MISCDDAEICQEDKIGVSIIYAYEDSDVYYPAKLLKHGIDCLCFASKEPIPEGEKIYIMTQDFPIEGTNLRIYEGCFAQVEECKKYENFKKTSPYLIRGKSMSGKTMNIGFNELGVEVL
jgi:hypothetical protein